MTKDTLLYDSTFSTRKMRIMLDESILRTGLADSKSSEDTILSRLVGYLRSDQIELTIYCEKEQSVPSALRIDDRCLRKEQHTYSRDFNIIFAGARESEGYDDWIYTTATRYDKSTRSHSHSMLRGGDITKLASNDDTSKAYDGLANHSEKRLNDTIAALISRDRKFDLYITDRDYLYDISDISRLVQQQSPSLLRPSNAIPEVCLFLRSKNIFLLEATSDGRLTITSDKATHYIYGALALLRSNWTWGEYSALVAGSEPVSMKFITYNSSLKSRIVSILNARDRMHYRLRAGLDNDNIIDLIDDMTSFLIYIMSAFDIAAQFINTHYELECKKSQIGWQNTAWLKEVGKHNSALAKLFSSNQASHNYLEVIRQLRNTIHSTSFTFFDPTQHRDPVWRGGRIAIRGLADRSDFYKATEKVDPVNKLGITDYLPGQDMGLLDPRLFIDGAIKILADVLNQVMESTDVLSDTKRQRYPLHESYYAQVAEMKLQQSNILRQFGLI